MRIEKHKNSLMVKYEPLFNVVGLVNQDDKYHVARLLEKVMIKYNLPEDVDNDKKFSHILIPLFMKIMKIFSMDGTETDVKEFIDLLKDPKFRKAVKEI